MTRPTKSTSESPALTVVACTAADCQATTTADPQHADQLARVWRCRNHYGTAWPTKPPEIQGPDDPATAISSLRELTLRNIRDQGRGSHE